jgi:hypothetical protein
MLSNTLERSEWANGIMSESRSVILFGAGATFGRDIINDALSYVWLSL